MLPQFPSAQPENKKSKLGFILGPIALIIVIGVVYFVSRQATEKVYKNFKPIEPDLTAITASPTQPPAQVTVDPKQYTVSILNGSGITGQAGEIKKLLEDKGFVVNSVGNADKEDYTQMQIAAKKEVTKPFISEIKNALSKAYTIREKVDELKSDASEDIEIITAPAK